MRCRLASCCLATLLLLPLTAAAQYRSILLRNVTVLTPTETTADTRVNLLIKDGLLDVVTRDNISLAEADVTFDVEGRVLIGQLDPGEPASFLILDQDPRTAPEVLLDTRAYTRFAILRGELQRNRLLALFEETPEERTLQQQGWLAYTPPPLAVPSDYFNRSRWNRFESRWVSGIVAGAVVLDRTNWLDQNDASIAQVGDLNDFSGGEIRGLRFGGAGTINFEKPWVWTLFGATHAFDKGFEQNQSDSFSIFDARLDIPLFDQGTFSIGKQKEPISMQRLVSLVDQPMQERTAASDAFFPARNTGLVASGRFLGNQATLAGGVFNNFLDKDQPSSLSANATQLVGRGTWVPWVSDNESTLLHLGAGFRYSTAREGVRMATEPEFNLAPTFVDTGLFDADNALLTQWESSLRSGPFWLHGEYYRQQVTEPDGVEQTFGGFDVTASWIITGEVRPYRWQSGIFDGVPIARAVNQGGWGAWELAVRYSEIDLVSRDILGGEMAVWSAGVNWLLNPYMSFGLNYRYIDLEQDGMAGRSQGINARLVLVLE